MKRAAALFWCAALAGCAATPNSSRTINAIAFIPSRDSPRCAITSIVDGDTIKVACGDRSGTARLIGFDAPESYRPRCQAEKRAGHHATKRLEWLLGHAHTIAPDVRGKDKYGRTLLHLELDGVGLDKLMVSEGLAVYYSGGKRIDWCKKLGA